MGKKIYDAAFWSDTIKFWTIITLQWCYYKLFKSSRKFQVHGKEYSYFYHRHNTTYRNERAVEIPIITELLNDHIPEETLEIGNVVSHYFKVNHDIVDKYEKVRGVINEDVVDFRPANKYRLIISISTLEHVGWDEQPREPKKIFPALKNLKKCLAHGGLLVVTIPLGQNPILDKYIEMGQLEFTESYYLKRISKDNQWEEVRSNFSSSEHGYPFPGSNVVFVGVYHK
jgi:hypothetical protein